MPDRSITSANAILMFAISGLFDTPLQLQQFAADDIFTTNPVQTVQTAMGMDGYLAAGFVYVPITLTISLQANSPSNDIFDEWQIAQRTAQDIYLAQATVQLPSIGKKWTMNNGVCSSWPSMPSAARTLQPRRYEITWESVIPQNA